MKEKQDPWAHIDGSPHAADGPLGCLPCSVERRKLTPEELRKIRPRAAPVPRGPKTREQDEIERLGSAFLGQVTKK